MKYTKLVFPTVVLAQLLLRLVVTSNSGDDVDPLIHDTSGDDVDPLIHDTDDYLIISPRTYRPGTTVKLGLHVDSKNKSCEVKVILMDGSKTISQANGTFHSNQSGELELKVPHTTKRYLDIQGFVCGSRTERRRIDLYFQRERVFIQTDKPIYKPGQKVQMRIISVDSDLKPFGSKVSSVTVEETSGSKIMLWNDVKLEDGIASLDLQLSKEPVLGKWKIKVVNNGDIVATEEIEIAKYVLPKYEVIINPPPYLALDQNAITTSICAKYTYGKPVKGMLDAMFCMNERWSWGKIYTSICHNITKEITGCTEITLSREELLIFSSSYYLKYLNIKATVTETSTGIKKSAEASTSRLLKHSIRIQLSGTSRQFIPGMPFQFTLKVTRIDGTPVPGAAVEVSIDYNYKVESAYYMSTAAIYNKKIIVKSGVFIEVVNAPPNARRLQLKAKMKVGDHGSISDYRTSYALYSPSLSYVKLVKTRKGPTKVNHEGSVKVLYTVRSDTGKEVNFHHRIMCKGNLVHSGLHTQYPNFTQGLTQEPITDLPITRPIVREFELRFPVTQEMVPFCRVLVYYVRSDSETVADSIVYDIEDTLENQVSISFVYKEKKPGSKTKLILKAKPGSRVAVAGIDKSVLLLSGGNEVTKREIMRVLDGLDVGRSGDYNHECAGYTGKQHKDTSEAFNEAGVMFLSNLNIFTQTCRQDWDILHARIPTYPPTALWFLRRGSSPVGGTVVPPATVIRTMAIAATHQATPAIKKAKTTKKPYKTKPRRKRKEVTVRSNFPETWLWTDIKLNKTTGYKSLEVQVPDTITTWIITGFAMSSSAGMGISDQTSLKAWQPFFVQLNLLYSVIRGEEIPITATVFNYMTSCVAIKVDLDHTSADYKVTSYHISKLCVCGDTSKSAKFHIIPYKVGHISVLVRAETSSANLCPNATVAAADAVSRKLLVEAEGIKQEYTKGTFFCAKGGYNETFDLNLPKNIVPDSVYATVSITGDVMGPALSNLDRLLEMPYGCGEQNMAKFAPNIYIMDYLTETNQVTEKVNNEALLFMRSGYQRELTYKRTSGSYSAFGESDNEGSMMLTAFVVRSFARAKKYIFVDVQEIQQSIAWFERKQLYSGCFPNYGKVFSRELQSGLNKELTITAYVTIALLEAGQTAKSPMVSKALACIAKRMYSIEDSYTTALVAYSLTFANHAKAGVMIKRLKSKAILKGDVMYWSSRSDKNPEIKTYYSSPYNLAPSADVEMTGYALLALSKQADFSVGDHGTKIIRWLSKQRNSYGGFSSTQDTCVALEALSKVAQKFYGDGGSRSVEASIKITDVFKHDFSISEHNRVVLQRVEIPRKLMPNKLEVTANGSGCALLQATVRYNIPKPDETPAFDVNVKVLRRSALYEEKNTASYPLQLRITAKWLKDDVSNMAIVDVKLVTGFTVNAESLERVLTSEPSEEQFNGTPAPTNQTLRKDPSTNFKRYEIEGQHVLLYFDEIKYLNFTIDIIQSSLVKKVKPAVVRVYDYYNPENQGKVMYEITEKDRYGNKIENECPKCMSVADLKALFNKDINCSSYLIRAKSKQGMLKVKKAYIKTDKKHNRVLMPYEIPEFCPCDEIFEGAVALMFAQNNYLKNNGIVLDSGTKIVMWNGKEMKKIFDKKIRKIYRKCSQKG